MQNDPSLSPALTAALSRLIVERVITRFAAQTSDPPPASTPREVHVWIRGHDELSVARARRRVEDALSPLKGVTIIVHPEARAIRDNCGND
jgi:hypothetical protein